MLTLGGANWADEVEAEETARGGTLDGPGPPPEPVHTEDRHGALAHKHLSKFVSNEKDWTAIKESRLRSGDSPDREPRARSHSPSRMDRHLHNPAAAPLTRDNKVHNTHASGTPHPSNLGILPPPPPPPPHATTPAPPSTRHSLSEGGAGPAAAAPPPVELSKEVLTQLHDVIRASCIGITQHYYSEMARILNTWLESIGDRLAQSVGQAVTTHIEALVPSSTDALAGTFTAHFTAELQKSMQPIQRSMQDLQRALQLSIAASPSPAPQQGPLPPPALPAPPPPGVYATPPPPPRFAAHDDGGSSHRGASEGGSQPREHSIRGRDNNGRDRSGLRESADRRDRGADRHHAAPSPRDADTPPRSAYKGSPSEDLPPGLGADPATAAELAAEEERREARKARQVKAGYQTYRPPARRPGDREGTAEPEEPDLPPGLAVARGSGGGSHHQARPPRDTPGRDGGARDREAGPVEDAAGLDQSRRFLER